MIDINLLPKEKGKSPEPSLKPTEAISQPEEVSFFPIKSLMTGVIVIIFVGGLTFGLYIYKNTKVSALEQLKRKITALKEEESKYKEVEEKAKTLQSQLNNLDNVLNKHKYWSAVLSNLADYTPQEVQYKSIVFEEKNNKFTVTGFANNYESLATLMISLKETVKNKEKIFDSIDLESAKLGFNENKEIKVEFSVTFNLKPGALKEVKPIKEEETSEKEKKQKQEEENIVQILRHQDGYAYWEPLELRIKKGEKVKWINNDQETHEVKSTSNLFDSGEIKPESSWEYKFEKEGDFEYFCPLHSKIDSPYQKPKIIVE